MPARTAPRTDPQPPTTAPTTSGVASGRARRRSPEVPSREQVAVQAWNNLQAAAHDGQILAATRALMDETGLSLPAVKALRLLPLDEPLAMRQLAARLRCDNSYVTSVVDTLEAHGVASRQPHPTDRRIKIIVLTEAGRSLARRAQEILARPPAGFAALSDAEIATLCHLLHKVNGDLSDNT